MLVKVALVQPHIAAGKSLGVEKAPESIQALAGQLEREGYTTQMFHEKAGDKLYRKLGEFAPDYVGISTMTPNFLEGRKTAKAVKEINQNIPVILGGWHASGCVVSYLQNQESETIKEILNPESPFDFVVAGEGDLILPEMIRRIENGVKLDDLRGVGFLQDDGEIQVSIANRIQSLDNLADPSWGLPTDNYRDKRSGELDLSVHFHRACRFNCGFCSTPVVYGRGVRTFSADRAVKYIDYVLEVFKPQVITFTDEDFFANPMWVDKIVELISQRDFNGKYGVEFDTFASVNDLHRFEKRGEGWFLDKMKQVGFNSFTIGIESLNPEILRKYNKERMILPMMTKEQRAKFKWISHQQQNKMLVGHYLKCIQEAINFAYEHCILVVGDYMLGNLGENEKQVRECFEKFCNLHNLLVAYLPIFTPFPGTGMWREAYDSGKIIRDSAGNIDWSRFDASTGALDLGYDVAELRNELELQFYISERYNKDMTQEIEKAPTRIRMFRARFSYLNRLFPENKLVKNRLKELG